MINNEDNKCNLILNTIINKFFLYYYHVRYKATVAEVLKPTAFYNGRSAL